MGGLRLGGYAYDTASRRLSLDRGNGARTTWGWRPDGRVQDLAHAFTGGAAAVTFTHLYNRESALSARLVSDAAYQASVGTQATTPYAANALNQYATVGGTAFTYDLNGNLTGDGQATYRHDAQNRLVGLTQGATTVSYTYDPEGRRASRIAGGVTTRYLHAMGREIAAYTGAAPGTLAARHVPGPGLDEPLATVTGAPGTRTRLWYHADAQGSIIGRSGASGAAPAAAERFTYTPYGQTGIGSGTGQDGFRWLGRRLEPAAPGGFYDMRARAYAPGIGRFLQPDPVGTEGGVNLYAYARNSPLNLADTSGLSPVESGSPDSDIMQAAARRPQPWEQRQALEGGIVGGAGGGGGGRSGGVGGQPPAAAPSGRAGHSGGSQPGVGEVVFRTEHYAPRLIARGLDVRKVEQNVRSAIQEFRRNLVPNTDVVGRMRIDGVNVEYRLRMLPDGTVRVGTIFPVSPR